MWQIKIDRVFCVKIHIDSYKSNKSKTINHAKYYTWDSKYYYHLPIELSGCEYNILS